MTIESDDAFDAKLLRDRNAAAIHEAGHAVVGLVCGCSRVDLEIVQRKGRDSRKLKRWRWEKLYSGTATFHGRGLGKLSRAAISYGGPLAEILHNEPAHTDFSMAAVVINRASPADIAPILALGRRSDTRARNRAIAILRKHWVLVRGLAFELATNYRGSICAMDIDLTRTRFDGLL